MGEAEGADGAMAMMPKLNVVVRLLGWARRCSCCALIALAAAAPALAVESSQGDAPALAARLSQPDPDAPVPALFGESTLLAQPGFPGDSRFLSGTAPGAGLSIGGVSSMLAAAGETPGGTPQARPASVSSRQALVPALMSAVLPGSGQLRNGSVIKGIAFAAVELTGWMAWFSFRHQESEKYDDIKSFGGRYWDYERYHRIAPNADSCAVHECDCGLWSAATDSLIRVAQEQGGSRFYDYLTREAYACGWRSGLSRDLYLGLHDDREDLMDAKRLTGRLIFLNHVVAAVDAFLQARRVRLAGVADVGVRMTGWPLQPHPQLTFAARWD